MEDSVPAPCGTPPRDAFPVRSFFGGSFSTSFSTGFADPDDPASTLRLELEGIGMNGIPSVFIAPGRSDRVVGETFLATITLLVPGPDSLP